ncbi:DUF2817 domain-containing protein [Ferrovibrio terrae]|uniref:DUF2817 domain-containing protein n=1 Tax=Ferrovibrio terrae TaxID=2594003 RepID=A0A516H019_9PROT|nr:DUF2817 domain-containing protein [Ferrovibrio terrae]QDO97105.1 DUF2817 domain-containing protein [Ferrovibrio terrae]
MKSPVERFFSLDYSDARQKFLHAAAIAGGQHREYAHSTTGPLGERLTTDVVWLGRTDARNILVLQSGTHGVELYCGSACMIDILLHGRVPDSWAFCLIHAVNPWGSAWGRRETEDNIDLNRNYIDFDAALPRNDLYRDIHADLLLRDLSGAGLSESNAAIDRAAEKYGSRAVLTARSAGQYEFPDGLHYGGLRPSASRLIVEAVIKDYALVDRANVVVLDYHTGAGPFGYCEPIYLGQPTGIRYRLAKTLFGSWLTSQRSDGAVTPPQTGLGSELWERVGCDRAYLLALEFGTYPMTLAGGILRQDSYLHRKPGQLDWHASETKTIKNALREEYDPCSPLWRRLVLNQNRVIIEQFETYALSVLSD